ncbi:MAG: hypothetical protein ACYDFU_08935 [Nitrospirota bacterium]
MGKFFFTGLVLSIVISTGFPAYATIKGDMQEKLPIGQVLGNALGSNPTPARIKDAVAEVIKDGGNASQVVKIALSSGLDADAVISGAIAGGGSLTDIFQAALDAGFTADFISGVAGRTGASQDDIASAMATAEANAGNSGNEGMEAAGNRNLPSEFSGIPAGGAGGGGGGNVSNNH